MCFCYRTLFISMYVGKKLCHSFQHIGILQTQYQIEHLALIIQKLLVTINILCQKNLRLIENTSIHIKEDKYHLVRAKIFHATDDLTSFKQLLFYHSAASVNIKIKHRNHHKHEVTFT